MRDARRAFLPLLLAATACAGPKPPPAPIAEIPVAGDGTCDATPAQPAIGRPYDTRLADASRALSGARGLRIIRPGTSVTMDVRPDRLNIHVDGHERITRIVCG